MAERPDRAYAAVLAAARADVLHGHTTRRAGWKHADAYRHTAPDAPTARPPLARRAAPTRRQSCNQTIQRPIDLLPPRPCCFALGTLTTGTAAVFLQFVCAVKIRRVGRSIEARADTEAIDWGTDLNKVAQLIFV